MQSDNAPWHRGELVTHTLRQLPQIEFYRLPAYSPKLNGVEALWKGLLRRATHNRPFEELPQLCDALQAHLTLLRRQRHQVLSMIGDRPRDAA